MLSMGKIMHLNVKTSVQAEAFINVKSIINEKLDNMYDTRDTRLPIQTSIYCFQHHH